MWTPIAADTLRAADTDRDATATILKSSHAEGRLTSMEFDERLEQCFAAKTMGELRALVVDLPGNDRRPLAGLEWHGGLQGRRRFRPMMLIPVAFLVLLFVVPALIGGHAAWHHGPFDAGYTPDVVDHHHGFPWPLAIFGFITIGALLRLFRYSRYGRW